MTRVKLTSSRCGHSTPKIKGGPVIAWSQEIGDVVDIEDDKEARRMIDSGLAVAAPGVELGSNRKRG